MSNDPFVLAALEGMRFYFGTDGSGALSTTIPERAKKYQNITLASKAADRILANDRVYFEPMLLSRAASKGNMTSLMGIPELAEKRRLCQEKQSQRKVGDDNG